MPFASRRQQANFQRPRLVLNAMEASDPSWTRRSSSSCRNHFYAKDRPTSLSKTRFLLLPPPSRMMSYGPIKHFIILILAMASMLQQVWSAASHSGG
jgi:hypothetical protein